MKRAPRKVKAATRHARQKREGIAALGGYDLQLRAQGGGCAICGRKPKPGGRRLNIDHDHLTGGVRGLLCHRCNRAIAWFGDCPESMSIASAYIKYGWQIAVSHRDCLSAIALKYGF